MRATSDRRDRDGPENLAAGANRIGADREAARRASRGRSTRIFRRADKRRGRAGRGPRDRACQAVQERASRNSGIGRDARPSRTRSRRDAEPRPRCRRQSTWQSRRGRRVPGSSRSAGGGEPALHPLLRGLVGDDSAFRKRSLTASDAFEKFQPAQKLVVAFHVEKHRRRTTVFCNENRYSFFLKTRDDLRRAALHLCHGLDPRGRHSDTRVPLPATCASIFRRRRRGPGAARSQLHAGVGAGVAVSVGAGVGVGETAGVGVGVPVFGVPTGVESNRKLSIMTAESYTPSVAS